MGTKNDYGWYKCQVCSQHKRAWIESECYERNLCPNCIDGEPEKNYMEDQYDR